MARVAHEGIEHGFSDGGINGGKLHVVQLKKLP